MNTVNVFLIKTKADYAAAKARIRDLMENGGNPDEITAQARFIQDYEQRNFPIPDPDPIDALLFRMEQEGMDRNGLAALLHASSGRVSEILSRRRPLSIAMIRVIHEKFGISGDILIRSPRRGGPPTRTRASRSITRPV
jgi:HTH-type transcriptional regulator/antitoxin HigA